jgi:hypothetical protein
MRQRFLRAPPKSVDGFSGLAAVRWYRPPIRHVCAGRRSRVVPLSCRLAPNTLHQSCSGEARSLIGSAQSNAASVDKLPTLSACLPVVRRCLAPLQGWLEPVKDPSP